MLIAIDNAIINTDNIEYIFTKTVRNEEKPYRIEVVCLRTSLVFGFFDKKEYEKCFQMLVSRIVPEKLRF